LAYDEELAARVRDVLALEPDVSERKMFGGVCFMLRGNMCCGVLKRDLIVKLGPDDNERALAAPHTRPFDFTGRPTKGMVYVAGEGTTDDADLRRWVEWGVGRARSLPPK
jgi:TfoX/Sxy family transcriptional regulator of competence genes